MDILRETIEVKKRMIKIKIPAEYLQERVEVVVRSLKKKKTKKLHEIFLHPTEVKNLKLPARESLYER